MQDVFDNIIKLLTQKENEAVLKAPNTGDIANAEYQKWMMKSYGFKEAIEIVKQTAAEYNNGWIPCSERLPEEGGYYLVTYHGWSNGDYLPKFDDTYVRRLHYQKRERFTGWNHPRYCDDKEENDTNREVIAWQRLPLPFKDKE